MSIIKKERSKMTRQLKIYYRLTASKIIGPNDIMREFDISIRMVPYLMSPHPTDAGLISYAFTELEH